MRPPCGRGAKPRRQFPPLQETRSRKQEACACQSRYRHRPMDAPRAGQSLAFGHIPIGDDDWKCHRDFVTTAQGSGIRLQRLVRFHPPRATRSADPGDSEGPEMVRDTGIEPVTPSVSGRCSTAELTAHVDSAAGGGRLVPGTAGMQSNFWVPGVSENPAAARNLSARSRCRAGSGSKPRASGWKGRWRSGPGRSGARRLPGA